jgi:NADH-quinone oxidoreductase subunit H
MGILILIIYNFTYILLLVVFLLVAVAFFTLGERKLMAAIQRRKGPDVVGFWGLLQPIADGVKLLLKEMIIPMRASLFLFLLGPSLVFILSILGWAFVPYGTSLTLTMFSLTVLFNFSIAGMNVYGLIIAGWASNSRYAFLGGVRAAAQMVSYELTLGVVNLIVALFAGSFNYVDIVNVQSKSGWFIWPLFPIFLIYLILMLAETNRTPFDLSEAEAELVAGYNVEYSSMTFAFFFLGEYANMLILSVIATLYFLGGWGFFGVESHIFLFIKMLFFAVFFIWVRATLPRYRYDQLMMIGWKYLLPISLGFFIFYLSLLFILSH